MQILYHTILGWWNEHNLFFIEQNLYHTYSKIARYQLGKRTLIQHILFSLIQFSMLHMNTKETFKKFDAN